MERTGLCVRIAVFLCVWRGSAAQVRYSIPEELKEGAVVGNIAKDLGLGLSTLKERGFRIVSGSKEPLFQVNQNDGILYVNRAIDREAMCERSGACVLSVKAVLESPLEVHHVAVEVVDVNDHGPRFTEKERRLEIAESALPGARFQLQAALDPDAGVNSVQTYKLSSNDHFRLEVKDRGVDSKVPFLIVQKALDRETTSEHHLVLTASDGGKPPRSGEMRILVDVLDVNDNTPVFTKDIYSVSLHENAPLGTTVLRVNATDMDEGSNGEVVYSFGRNINEKIRDIFELDKITGEIIVRGSVDFEEKNTYEIDIQASDMGSTPWTVDGSVILKIVDMNDNAPDIEVTSFSSSIPESSRAGTILALISVNDADSGQNGRVSCSLREGHPFKLLPSLQDHMFSLVTMADLDRESSARYDITVMANDGGQPPLWSFKTISVEVSDVNDNSPEFPTSPYVFYLLENNTPGAPVFTVNAFDRDQNENAIVSYEIWKDAHAQNNMANYLNINSDSGVIYALKSFDFETLKTFQFQVVAKDSGTPSLSSNVTVNVFILDQNDNAPVILSPVSANGSAEGVEEVPRNVNAGHSVAKVRAFDADIGYNAWLSFSLQHATDASLFGLERYTGQIRTLRLLTETDEAEQRLVIVVKDNGNVSLSATATVSIKAVEPKEAFAASDTKSAVQTEEENNVTFYLIITLSSVSALFLLSIIGLIVMQCSKPPDYSPKYSRDSNYADTSGNGTLCHSIQYRSGDKRYMLVGPRMSIGSAIVPGSHANTLMVPDLRNRTSGEPKAPNADWRYSASLRAGMQSSVHMEESSVMQGAQGVLVQNWPTVSSATADEGGEVSPPAGAGMNSWNFRYGPGPGYPPQALKPGDVPEAFIIPGSPAIISIRQDQGGPDDKSDFITFGKKEEKKKKKKKKGKEKKEKERDGEEE
ncbi:protocadherin alpha-8-like isoform X7 [Conger conger]|uniref:protocadherin alpha-8-like isoform X7 n=1 Tax=Conger conger TaxID=82655 RepID=UPI002A5A33F9|nr:protocadherin alpha-8-like isoform X7 [Conger conger]